jgi:hypothetical protein
MCYILKTITPFVSCTIVVKNGQNNIDLIRLFSYTLKHYVVYFYEYLCKLKDMRKVFEKNFLSDNTIVQETNGVATSLGGLEPPTFRLTAERANFFFFIFI